jgi:hypothetical protein
MVAEPEWQELRDRLNDFCTALVSRLMTRNRRLWSQIGHQETPAFPFTGYVSLGKSGEHGREDLVLEWAIQRREGRLRITAEIAKGDGTALAELPAEELAEPVGHESIVLALERAVQFFRSQMDLIEREVG